MGNGTGRGDTSILVDTKSKTKLTIDKISTANVVTEYGVKIDGSIVSQGEIIDVSQKDTCTIRAYVSSTAHTPTGGSVSCTYTLT